MRRGGLARGLPPVRASSLRCVPTPARQPGAAPARTRSRRWSAGLLISSGDGPAARSITPHVVEVAVADHGMFVPGALSSSVAVLGQVMTAVERFLDHVVWPARVLPDQGRLAAPAAAAQDFLGDSQVLRAPPQVPLPSPLPACSRSPERFFDAAPVLRPWTTRTGRA